MYIYIMRITILLLFYATGFTAKAQEPEKPPATKKFALGISFSGDRCFFLYTYPSIFKLELPYKHPNGHGFDYLPKFSFTAGLNFNWVLNKRFALEGGILYANKGYKSSVHQPEWSTPGPHYDPTLPHWTSFTANAIYIDVPVRARYNFIAKKAKLYGLIGLSTNFFKSSSLIIHEKYDDGTKKEITITNGSDYSSKVNLAAIVGIGFSYDISERTYIKLEPVCRFSVTPIRRGDGYYYTQMGIDIGYYFRF